MGSVSNSIPSIDTRCCPGKTWRTRWLMNQNAKMTTRCNSIRFDSIRFKEARDGDHLITPFQCVECHFVNIQGRLPDSQLQCDRLAEIAITRAIRF